MIVNDGDGSATIFIGASDGQAGNDSSDLGVSGGSVGVDTSSHHVTQAYKWVCHGPHPCDECRHNAGKVKSLDDWRMTGYLPGWHYGCKCDLIPTNDGITAYSDSAIGYQSFWSENSIGDPAPPEDNTWHFLDD